MIEAYGEPVVTDGVTVKSIEVGKIQNKPVFVLVLKWLKASSSKTNDKGLGTERHHRQSSPYLAWNGLQKKRTARTLWSPLNLTKLLKCSRWTWETGRNQSRLKNKYQSRHYLVWRWVIGREVGKLYHKLGKNAMVTVEIDQSLSETGIHYLQGYTVDRGIFNPILIDDSDWADYWKSSGAWY